MKIFQFIKFVKAVINTIFGRGAILLLPFLPGVASCQHSAFFNAGEPLLLDVVPGATAAFSVRQLSSTYTGSAVEVRRASDNATQQIGFEGGQIDLGVLTSFCNGTDCFVRTWYDQSGNGNHATQTTAANQPKIWDSSTGVILENGKPGIRFDGTDDFLDNSGFGISGNDPRAYFIVSEIPIAGNYTFLSQSDGTTNGNGQHWIITSETAGLAVRIFGGNIVFNQDAVGYNLISNLYSGSNVTEATMFKNGISLSVASSVSKAVNTIDSVNYIGKQFGGSPGYFPSIMQEIIMYNSDKAANRLAIETNVNNFFSIY